MRFYCEKCLVSYSQWEGHECPSDAMTPVNKVTEAVTPPDKVTQTVTPEQPMSRDVTEIVTAHECPTCGRPYPMSNAERQRRYRERQKVNG